MKRIASWFINIQFYFASVSVFFILSCQPTYYIESDYYKVSKIDAHVHISTTDASILKHSLEENLKLVTINVNSSRDVNDQRDTAIALIKKFPQTVYYLATFAFDTAIWNGDNWEHKTIAELENNLSGGAVGVKLWKNIGMAERDRTGNFIMVSHERFDPVISFIEQKGLPLTGHLGEPKNCWMPVDSMTVNNDKSYFKDHPEYHMFLHPEYPSYQDQIDARDSILVKHPKLKFIGCHLGSEEWNVDELAKALDRFPNMAVDLAARICHLQYQSAKNRDKVRDFLISYQDRILYGTDIDYSGDRLDSSFYSGIRATRIKDWNYFTGDMQLKSHDVNATFIGLHLPKRVVDKIFYLNAVKWYKLVEM